MSSYRLKTAAALAALAIPSLPAWQADLQAQTFEPTTGSHVWNDNNNWGPSPPQPFPNSAGAFATLPAPTGDLTVDLGQPITIGSLTITKSLTAAFTTTITGTAPNQLFFDGGGTINTTDSTDSGGGASVIAAPVSFNGPLTITQGDDQVLRFTGALSGSGSVNIKRDTTGDEYVAFSAANSYTGTTTVTGNIGTAFAVLRLNEPKAVPGGLGATGGTSNIILTNSGILGLGSTDFNRNIGTGPDQIQFVTPVNSGFAAFGGTRIVNFGGASAPLDWATSGIATLTFGAPTSDGTLEFQNPIDFGNAARSIRVVDGTAPIDARLTASITSTGASNNFTKTGSGTLSLTVANSYTGNTIINAGVLRVDHPQALPANTNIALSAGGVLALGVADYAANIGTGAGQIQFGTGNSGFAANGADRKVTLNGGAPLVWGATGGFTVAGNFILSDAGADSLVEITNSIDLNGASRTLAGRDGTAPIDSRISGVITGTGGITKTQPGTLDLAAANTYTGDTVISGGVLLLTNANSLPGGISGGATGNLSFVGGVVGLGQSDFTAPLGYGPGQVQWATDENGGFAAFGADRKVNLGGAGAQVQWGVNGFTTVNLILSWAGSSHLVEFVNPIDLNGGARTFAGRDGNAAVDSRVSGVVSGTGSIIKTQPGTLEFTNANTFDGGASINAGRLLANNTTGSAFGTGDVTVNANGTLGGDGFIGNVGDTSNVTVNADGHLAPGVEVGKLTVTGDVTFLAGSFFDIGATSATPATGFDQLFITGAATLAGTLHIDTLDGFAPAAGTTLQVLSASTGVTGTFDAITSTGGTTWQAVYGANSVSIVAQAGAFAAADFNQDGAVNSADLTAWQGGFGTATGATKVNGDSDVDGDVDGADFLTWQRQLTGGAATPTTASVPEPGSFGMFVTAALGNLWLRVRRRVAGRRLGAESQSLRRASHAAGLTSATDAATRALG